jgi:hypothetical protein
MDKERFTERILETENLTDELDDADANQLLDWGIARLDTVLQGVKDEETAGNRVNSLMAVMRKINRITGSYARQSPQALAEDLATLRDLFAAAFGSQAASAGAPANAAANATTGAFSWKARRWPWTYKKPQERPAQPSLESAAAHLSTLSPREALEYLANQFYPTTSSTR